MLSQADNINAITGDVIAAAIEVHRTLGPGLLESIYRDCLRHELELRCRQVEAERAVPVFYKGRAVGPAFRFDLVVDQAVLVEIKAVQSLHDVHLAQTLTYLKLLGLPVGLLLNFHVPALRDGIRRVIHNP